MSSQMFLPRSLKEKKDHKMSSSNHKMLSIYMQPMLVNCFFFNTKTPQLKKSAVLIVQPDRRIAYRFEDKKKTQLRLIRSILNID